MSVQRKPGEFVAVSRFDVVGDRPLERFGAARAYVSPFFDLRATEGTFLDTPANSLSYHVDNIVFEKSSFGPMALTRNPAKRFDPARETVTLWLMLSGQHNGIIGETTFQSHPGEVHLLDSSRSLDFVATRRDIATLHLPYDAVGYDPRLHPPHLCLRANTAAARILAQTLSTVFTLLPTMRRTEAATVASGVSALVRELFDFDAVNKPERKAIDVARTIAAREWLDSHLEDLSLQADSPCYVLGLSRSTVYRLFKEDGGVAAYLRRQRLQRAYLELAVTQERIRDVAERWGFPDPSHFHRVFHAQFGLSPSMVRTRISTPDNLIFGSTGTAPSPVINWLVDD